MLVILDRLVQRLLRPAQSASRLAIGGARDLTRTRPELMAENALLRQRVIVLRRHVDRPRLHCDDRLLLLALVRLTDRWRDALHLVSPETLLRWHRDLFKNVWRRKSRPKRRTSRLAPEFITLIQTMATDNVLWRAERIRGELLKLSIRVSKRTIQKYMRQVRPPGKRGQTWSTFIRNHAPDVWACDFLQHYDVLFRPIFAFFFVVHGTRNVVHFHVTRHPTDAWVAQQLREATPFGDVPRYLIRDNNDKFGKRSAAVAEGSGIEIVNIPPRSPNLNAICERFVGSVRRECLDHVLILGERYLRRVLREYVEAYFNAARPHQGLRQQIPGARLHHCRTPADGNVVAIPILGGLHHDYQLAALSLGDG